MKSFKLWLFRPLWVPLLALLLTNVGVRSTTELVCMSAIAASITFLWTMRKLARQGSSSAYQMEHDLVAFERIISICMSFLWIDHSAGVLLPMLIWIPLCVLDITTVHLTHDVVIDLTLVVFIQHIVSIFYQAGMIQSLKNLFDYDREDCQ